MNFWRLAVLIVATSMLSTSPARACSVVASSSRLPCQLYTGGAVFVGQVTAVQPFTEREPGAKRYSFHVQKVYRGEIGATVDVVGGSGGGDCRYSFRPGVTYLVSAHSAAGVLYASKLSGTKPLENAQSEIAWLEMSGTLPPGGDIFGKVSQDVLTDGYRHDPLAGVSITLRDSAGREYRTATDASGAYLFRGLEAGKYVISPERPSTVFFWAGELVRQSVDIEVYDRGCREANFDAVINGRIRGRVLDSDGSPVPNVTVGVQRADAPNPWNAPVLKTTSTAPDGSYAFVGLSAGAYIVVLSPSGLDKESPYPRRFYPGTDDVSQTIPVQLGEGEEISNIDIRLPQKLTP